MTRSHHTLRTPLAPLALLLILVLAGCASDVQEEAAAPAEVPSPAAEATTEAEPTPVADPVRIRVPAIDVDAEIVEVGLADDGSMEVPDFGLAAWYTEGPKPGESGPSVIVAHVDSKAGPDVFYRLGELEPGAEIHVDRADGSTATWVAESSEQTDKDELPTERIWNDTDEPVLRLVTCGGEFDRSIGHYTDNITVYANPQTV